MKTLIERYKGYKIYVDKKEELTAGTQIKKNL